MARSRSAAPADHDAGVDGIDTSALDTWIEQQRDLLDSALGQWTQNQQALMTAWFQWLDGASALWRVPGWPAAPEDLFMAGPRMMQAWWAPWAPFMQRGGEQLG
jgi:hypothetical protein